MNDRSIKLAELVFAWIELREHILATVPRSNVNVYTTLTIVDRRVDVLIATHNEPDPINKTLAANARKG